MGTGRPPTGPTGLPRPENRALWVVDRRRSAAGAVSMRPALQTPSVWPSLLPAPQRARPRPSPACSLGLITASITKPANPPHLLRNQTLDPLPRPRARLRPSRCPIPPQQRPRPP